LRCALVLRTAFFRCVASKNSFCCRDAAVWSLPTLLPFRRRSRALVEEAVRLAACVMGAALCRNWDLVAPFRTFFPQKKKDGGKAAHPLVLTVRRAQENRPTRLLVCKGMNPCSLPQFSSSSSVRKLTEKEVKKRGKDETIDATVLVAKLAIACASLFGVVSFGPSWLAGRARGAGYFSQREKESPLLVEATPSVEV